MKNSMKAPLKTKTKATILFSTPTPGHISRENHKLKRCIHPNVHCSTIYNSQDLGTNIHQQMNGKRNCRSYTHTHTMDYYSAIKKNEIILFAATWMDLEIIILSEISQTEKDKHHMISLTYGI